MTVPVSTYKSGPYTGNSVTTSFPFDFKVFAKGDLRVILTDIAFGTDSDLVLDSDYSVTLNPDQDAAPGGTITYPLVGTPMTTANRLTVASNLVIRQPLDITNLGGFYPQTQEDAFDRAVILIGQLALLIAGAFRLPLSAPTGISTELPLPEANAIVAWNAAANALQNLDPVALATVVAFGTAQSDVFSGDGATKDFVLTANPGALNNLDVDISGVTQKAGDDFTWASGTTISFVTAPPVGVRNVHVRYLQALPQGVTDSAASTFVQAGTGAITRLVQDRLREMSISVKDFGARGDGVTNDTAAVQAAITYAETIAGTVYFPPGTYKITAALTCKRISLLGHHTQGVTIMGIGVGAGVYLVDYNALAADVVEQVSIKNITIRSDNGSPNGVRLKNISYPKVEDVQLYTLTNGITLEGSRCFTHEYDNVTGYNVTGRTVRWLTGFTGGGQFTFTGCTFTGDTGVDLPTGAAIDNLNFHGCNFEQCVTESLRISGTCAAVAILGCRTEGCNGVDFDFRPFGAAEYVGGINISGCVLSASDSGGVGRIFMGGDSGKVRGFSITGNVVTHGTDTYGAALVNLNGEGESGIVAGNLVRGTNASGAAVINTQRAGVIVFANENLTGKLPEWWGAAKAGISEGSWTPVDTSGASLSFTGATGAYRKEGRMVFVRGFWQYPATASGANAQIGGLPFNVDSSQYDRSGPNTFLTDAALGFGIVVLFVDSSANISPRNMGTLANITNANMSGKQVYFSGIYMTA